MAGYVITSMFHTPVYGRRMQGANKNHACAEACAANRIVRQFPPIPPPSGQTVAICRKYVLYCNYSIIRERSCYCMFTIVCMYAYNIRQVFHLATFSAPNFCTLNWLTQ